MGIIGSFITIGTINSWYKTLSKPSFNPPNWVFGPVWTILYLLMGISAYLIWQKGVNKKKVKVALSIFGLQLILNFLWSFLFFGLHSPLVSFVEIILFWIMILFTIFKFYKLSKPASYLLIPYIFWVSFAAILNLSIVILN